MFFADHNPPHFHVLGREGTAQVRIDTIEVMAMAGKLDLREAIEWARENHVFLKGKWDELSGDGT